MASITGVELKARLDQAMVDWGCKRTDLLCFGKSTHKVDKVLKTIYPFWSIIDQCVLTEDEINCIVNKIKKYCNFSVPSRTNRNIAPPPTSAAVKSGSLNVILTQEWDFCPVVEAQGDYTLTAATSGGTAPYNYVWDCVPTGIVGAICVSNPQDTGTTNTITLPADYQSPLKIKVTVTDSLGVVVEKDVLFNTKGDPCY